MEQEQIIQCPTCGKKYRLKGAPPPTFTCRGCQTVMDLSGFQAAAAPAPGPVETARRGASPPRGGGGGAPSSRHRPGHRAGASSRRSRRGEPAADAGEDEGRPRYSGREKKPNTALLIGSVAGVVVAGLALFLFMTGGDKPDAKKDAAKNVAPVSATPPETTNTGPETPTTGPATTDATESPDKPNDPPKEKPKPKDVEEARPELSEGDYASIPIPEGKTKYGWNAARIQTYPWPSYVTGEEKNQIDQWVHTLVWGSGRDADEAGDALVKLDAFPKKGEEFKAVGRLITEFKNVLGQGSASDPMTLARLRVIDRTLRRIDGAMEREFKDIDGININSSDRDAERLIKRWNWWYDLEKWRLRRQPYDPREDMTDSPDSGGDDGGLAPLDH